MKLDGIKVVDLSLFLPGPAMTQAMADHGADVIKVEPPGGEPNRAIGLKRDGVSVFFANTHRCKRSLVLDLKTEDGVEALLRLAERADVFVESFRPGVVDRLGVGYAAVSARNPRIVYASISAYGQSGPYRGRPAHDLAVQAMSGVLSVNLGWDDRPCSPALAAADMLAASNALAGVLMALLQRERTGKGDYVDVAMMDSLIAAMPNNYGPPLAEKREPVAKDERSWGGNAMYRLYETRDGRFVALGGAEIKFARNLLTALGRPDLVEVCRLSPGPGQQPVRDFLEQAFRERTRDEWVAWMADKDVAFAPVNGLREGLDDPQVRAREMVVQDQRGWEHIGLPVKFQDEPGRVDPALAEPGEHSEAILRGLGYSDAELRAMKAKGFFEGAEMDLGLNGKVALVTGGSRGIGRACAARLAGEGCDVLLVARTESDLGEAAAAIGQASGRRVEICATDLRSPQGCEAAVGALKHAFGRLDVLVNNAGATQSGDFFKLDDALWEDGFALKFYSYVRLSRALWPLLKDSQGSVVNVIGAASKTPTANFMIGGAVNAAITNFTKALAEVGLKDGVAVKAVHPGMTVTGRLERLLEQRAAAEGMSRADYERQELARAGLRRYSEPEDIAALVAFLASPVAQQIHGADVFIDGGATKAIL